MTDKPMILLFPTGIYHISRSGRETYCRVYVDLVTDLVFTKTWADVDLSKKCRHCDRIAAKIEKIKTPVKVVK